MTTTMPTAGADRDLAATRRAVRPGWLLATVLTGQFMALLDVFIVNVAAPTLRSDLGASGGELQLVVAGYTIAYAVLLVTGARLGGRFGPGRLYLGGLALFTAASLACGVAGSAGLLIAFRFVQGTGAALMLPQVLALIQRTFAGPARARALTLFSAVLATGGAAGQLAGGVLINADLFGWGWRPVFLVNVPIGVALLVLGARVLPLSRPEQAARRALDVPGLVLLTAAVTLFTVPLVLGQEEDWPLWTWLSLGGSAVLLAAFAAFEVRLARRGGAPLIAPRVLGAPGMPLAAARIFLAMAINGGLMFAFSLHLQTPEAAGGLGHGALHTGLLFVPIAVCFGGVSLLWRSLPAAWHPRLSTAGFLISAAAMLGAGLLLRDGGDVGVPEMLLFAVNGTGLALAYSPVLTGALALVRPEDASDASGVTGTMTQLGLLVGVATLGTLYLVRAESGGSSADGLWATAIGLSATALAAAAAGLVAARARPDR
jgi:MFS family permease